VDTDQAYKNVMTKFTFGNAKNPKVYFDEENRRHLNSMRFAVADIAQALVAEGKKDSAKQILRKIDSEINTKSFPYGMTSNRGNQHNYFSFLFAQSCYTAGEYELGKKVATEVAKDLKQQLAYYRSLGEQMSEDQFMQNIELAYQGKPSALANKQMSFVQDALTSYQLLNAIAKLEQDVAKLNAPATK
jgi:RNA 3'-terminal phosphate cyclase